MPKSLVYRVLLCLVAGALLFAGVGLAIVPATAHGAPIEVVVDTDAGVDDAAAIAYLLSVRDQASIVGITAVAGNTSVEYVANNVLVLLDGAGRKDIPVVIGAAAPLTRLASHQGMFVHGPDGLWFYGLQSPHDLSKLSTDAPGFLCEKAAPGRLLLALGPLTNVANAVQKCASAMQQYRIVWLGGAKATAGEGNTPVSVFNPWFDPEAAEIVLTAGLHLTMVTTDAAREVTVDPTLFDRMAKRGTPLGKLMAGPLKAYASAMAQSGETQVALYDPATAVLALRPDLAKPQSALVTVQTNDDGPARGQTYIALTVTERISLLANDEELSLLADQAFSTPDFDLQAALGAILMRQPDNVQVILSADAKRIRQIWQQALTK
jgi:inosine-uridine nucleoside N-ribohydrolase